MGNAGFHQMFFHLRQIERFFRIKALTGAFPAFEIFCVFDDELGWMGVEI